MIGRCMDCQRRIWPWQKRGSWWGYPDSSGRSKVYRWHWKCEVIR